MRNRCLELEREIIDEITAAFGKLKCPPDDLIVCGDDIESAETRDAFKGVHWKKVDSKFLFYKHSESLYFFTPMAFRFYLPAYMIVMLREFDKADIICDIVISSLTLCENNAFSNKGVFEIFSQEQKQAVRLFLEYISKTYADNYLNNEPAKALELYWGR